jgi:nucleotide-binding universal stress UspA family protein
MKNILIPFDFSEVSKNALKYAIQFAGKDQNLRLHLLHVSGTSMEKADEENLQQKFQNLILHYKGHIIPEIVFTLKTGELIHTIVDIREQEGIDLVIMGTKGAESGVNQVTQTSKFVLAADLPVLVIPPNYEFKLNKILLTLGEAEINDTSILNILLEVSRNSRAEVHVLTVSKKTENHGYSEADERNENTLQYYLEKFYSHHSFSENEDIVKGIDDYIKKNKIDMLAIMPNTHSNAGQPSKGKLTQVLTLKSNIPVLVLD